MRAVYFRLNRLASLLRSLLPSGRKREQPTNRLTEVERDGDEQATCVICGTSLPAATGTVNMCDGCLREYHR
jgi:hypothetical protein